MNAAHINPLAVAFEGGVPAGRVPVWDLEFHAWDKASGQHLILGREFESLSAKSQEYALQRNAGIMLSVASEMGWSGMTVPGDYWEQSPGDLAYFCLPPLARRRQMQILRREAPGNLLLVAIVGGVLSANYSEDFCLRMFEDPESIDQEAESLLMGSLEPAREFADLGADALLTASDVADNNGPFFNPAQMDRWIYPYLSRWADNVRSLGCYAILHSDGQLTGCLDRLARTGVHAIQAIDPVAGMEMSSAMGIVAGRVCLCGNIDCGLLLSGRPEEVFEATSKLLQNCAAGGALALGASNAVQPDVPMENYLAMIEASSRHGLFQDGAQES